jgi:simple sugar transport system substrate-binding protein
MKPSKGDKVMKRSFLGLAGSVLLAASLPLAAAAQDDSKTFYWISHGSPADPVWTFFLDGANQWAADTGHTVNTSFWNGDVPTQQEAVRAAIADGADGIVTSTPEEGALVEVVAEAKAAGIPIFNMNTPDPDADFDGYVGTVGVEVGRAWAQYLVDGGYVSEGDFVMMPVEVPGATYGVQEERGIATVFEPAGIEWEVVPTGLDQAEIITIMSDYLLANRDNVDAMIGLGDLVTGSVARVWDQVGIPPGEIPVVGWGNSPETAQEILDGYVLAGMWQEPQWVSYTALSLANAAASGIPAPVTSVTDAAPGFDIIIGTLYEEDTAQFYLDQLTGS